MTASSNNRKNASNTDIRPSTGTYTQIPIIAADGWMKETPEDTPKNTPEDTPEDTPENTPRSMKSYHSPSLF